MFGTQHSQAMTAYAAAKSRPATNDAGTHSLSVTAAKASAKLRTIQRRCAAMSRARIAR